MRIIHFWKLDEAAMAPLATFVADAKSIGVP
jgi:hypothetical protein